MAKLRTEDIRTGMCFANKGILLVTSRLLFGRRAGRERTGDWNCIAFGEVDYYNPGDGLWQAGIPLDVPENDLSDMEYVGAIPHMKDLMAGALTSGIYPQTPEHQRYDQEDQEADNF